MRINRKMLLERMPSSASTRVVPDASRPGYSFFSIVSYRNALPLKSIAVNLLE
jgi:hypothetical protein